MHYSGDFDAKDKETRLDSVSKFDNFLTMGPGDLPAPALKSFPAGFSGV